VFLETGAGKTLIAVLLLRRFANRIRSSPPPCFAVFLVPTVVLVSQQARVVRAHTDLTVAEFFGEMGVDFWNADKWRDMVDGAEVLVMTPQILLDNLRHSFFRLRDIPLLIFDECHHATGNSPYACIFKVTPKVGTTLGYFCPPTDPLVCWHAHLLIWFPHIAVQLQILRLKFAHVYQFSMFVCVLG
jgi:ERCC4-related helicase